MDAYLSEFNFWEAWLWFACAGVLALRALPAGRPHRQLSVYAALAFLLFGLSDLVEIRTGAWWRPWWLLTWKGACLVAFAALYYAYRRRAGNGGSRPKR